MNLRSKSWGLISAFCSLVILSSSRASKEALERSLSKDSRLGDEVISDSLVAEVNYWKALDWMDQISPTGLMQA